MRPAGSQLGHPVRVLCYHSIADLAGDPVLEPYGVPRPEFRRHLELLDRHFCLIGPDEFFRYLDGSGGVPRRAVLLTFDDCYSDLVTAALPELRARNASALAFVVTGRVGGTNDWDAHLGAGSIALVDEDGLEALRRGGIALGAHSRTHPNLRNLSDQELDCEVRGSGADLQALGVGRRTRSRTRTVSTTGGSRRRSRAPGSTRLSRSTRAWSGPTSIGTGSRGPRSFEATRGGASSGKSSRWEG